MTEAEIIRAAEQSRFRGAFMLQSVNHPDPLWRAEYARIREFAIAEVRRALETKP